MRKNTGSELFLFTTYSCTFSSAEFLSMRLISLVVSHFVLSCLSLQVFAQKPDYLADSLFVVSGKEYIQSKKDFSANVKIFCDGEYISLTAVIRDDVIENKPDNKETDHIEIRFALPQSAYPADFEYNLHPQYLYNPAAPDAKGKMQAPRFFSVYSEYASSVDATAFSKDYDYPSATEIQNKKLRVPTAQNLKVARLDYGIVHFGLFPDQRKVVHYNKANYRLLEDAWGFKLGNFAEGVKYAVDKIEGGYIISAQFSAQALGFVAMPKMEDLRFLIEVYDKDAQGKKATSILSSANSKENKTLRNFKNLHFRRPLRTNISDIPDGVFMKLDFHPIYAYTDSAWVATSVETDMIAYKNEQLSKSLIEIKFMSLPLKYAAYEAGGTNSVKRLSIDKEFVNTKPKKLEYYIINNQIFESEVVKSKQRKETLKNQTFVFPDGTAGLISKIRTPVNDYGWGSCANCVEEVISIIRVTKTDNKTILGIYQGNSGGEYCNIGELGFKGFYVSHLDWIQEGKILQLRLNSWRGTEKKRVRVSWKDDGSKVAVKEVL